MGYCWNEQPHPWHMALLRVCTDVLHHVLAQRLPRRLPAARAADKEEGPHKQTPTPKKDAREMKGDGSKEDRGKRAWNPAGAKGLQK